MANEHALLQCYNRGCGQKFDPNENNEDICCHHPGLPFFHDAYKGWSCCNRKCTDFTEFLNMKGCTFSKHSNIKPPEPEKPTAQEEPAREVLEVKPMQQPKIERPPIDTPMITMKPEISATLKQQVQANITNETIVNPISDTGDIAIGTACKNNGCTVSYQGSETNDSPCIYHSGSPIFHEGMKYWSCCQKKTTDFDEFLNQAGCQSGKHLWKKEDESDEKTVECRWDWHQTGSHVVISIYAKNYCLDSSIVQLNPIRLFANLVFPQQASATSTLDIELQRIIDVRASQVSMLGTKVEIKLKKAEPGIWSKIEVPRSAAMAGSAKATNTSKVDILTPQIELVDLSDL